MIQWIAVSNAGLEDHTDQQHVESARPTVRDAPEGVPYDAPGYLAIEIGGTKLQVAVCDQGFRVLESFRFKIDRGLGAAGIRDRILATLDKTLASHALSACGVGFGGPVDYRNGQVAHSYQIDGWSDFPLRDWLQTATGLPVAVDNDANTAALAEAVTGAGADYQHVFYVTLGSGVGGGFVNGKKIFHSARPGESEVGLMMLHQSGVTVQSRCSGWAVDARIRGLVEQGRLVEPPGWSAAMVGQEARMLGPAIAHGSAEAVRVVEELADDLSFALSHVVHLLHPDIIVLGGGLSLVGEILRQAVSRKIPDFITLAFQPGPAISLSALGEDVVLVGAAILAHRICNGPVINCIKEDSSHGHGY
jgi:glucokinase